MIDKTADLTSMENNQLPVLRNILDSIRVQALSVKYTSTLPTVNSVAEGQIVVYDDGAGTMRLYVVTKEKNLGYVNLS